MRKILEAKIETFDYCIEQVKDSIYFHLEEYSDQYYGFMEDVKRMEDMRNDLINELNSLPSE
jgi:hypothetical protein